MPRKLANYAIVACSVAALAVGWLARGESSQATAQPPVATRHSFQGLRSGSLARPTSTDSPDLEAWLTTTRDGLVHQRATLARQEVSPSTVVFDASMLAPSQLVDAVRSVGFEAEDIYDLVSKRGATTAHPPPPSPFTAAARR